MSAGMLALGIYWAYVVALLFDVLFLGSFVRVDWRAHPFGRNLLVFTVLLGIQEAIIATRVFGDWPGRSYVVLAVAWLFAATVAQRWWLQVRGRRRARHTRKDTSSEDSRT